MKEKILLAFKKWATVENVYVMVWITAIIIGGIINGLEIWRAFLVWLFCLSFTFIPDIPEEDEPNKN